MIANRMLHGLLSVCLILCLRAATEIYNRTDCIYFARQCIPHAQVYRAFFSPEDNIKKLLLGVIHSEQRMVLMAVYQITDDDIVEALIAARKRGVRIDIITDTSCQTSPHSKIPKLRRNGIAVKVYGKPYAIMHNKFVVFGHNINGKPLLWTGSANWTGGGTLRNEENVVVTEHPSLIKTYVERFSVLKQKKKTRTKEDFPELTSNWASLLQFLLSWFPGY